MNGEFDQQFERITVLGEGSFGKVYLCKKLSAVACKQNLQTPSSNLPDTKEKKSTPIIPQSQYYALKKMKGMDNENSLQNCRQVSILKHFNDRNLMPLQGMIQKDRGYQIDRYLVMDYGFELMEFAMHKQLKLSNTLIRQIFRQIAEGLKAMHAEDYIHRDVKPSNIFVMPDGTIRLADFSISRKIEKGDMTGNVTTRYYRAPQILFGSKGYSKQIDIWSLGCTFAEMILHEPLFPGKTQIHQLECIFQIIGYPQSQWKSAQDLPYYFEFPEQQSVGLQTILPNAQAGLLELLKSMLSLDPAKRPTIEQICQEEYLKGADEDLGELAKISHYVYEKKLRQHIASKK